MGYMVIIHLNVMLKDIILGHHGTTHWAFLTVTFSMANLRSARCSLFSDSWQVEVLNYPAK
jgi:hypothetical protein